jgi:hypothetical protein
MEGKKEYKLMNGIGKREQRGRDCRAVSIH